MAGKRILNANTVRDELKKPSPKLKKQFKLSLLLNTLGTVTPKSRVVEAEYNKDYEQDIKNLEPYFAEIFGSAVYDDKKKEINITGRSGSIKVNLKQKKAPGGKRETINTKIQEEGTTIVLNQVIHKNKKFNKKEDILADKETADELKKLFGRKYADRLEEWTHSYFEQQKEFLKKFQSAKWDIFVYGRDDFVTFFSKQIKNVARSLDPLKPVGDYTTWSPSDIWAVYEMDKVKKEIAKNINPKTQNLVELNNLLINLFEQKKLIGLSLKKIDPNQSANLKFVNIDTSTMKLGDIEKYKMSDISFNFDNISIGDKVTTYIKFGKQGDYSINITRAGQNLSFNTAIKATPAAQGGQAPVKMVQDLMKKNGSGITFVNDHNKYPQSYSEYIDQSDKYLKMYESIKKYLNKNITYSEFKDNLSSAYEKDKRNAIAKLMTLNFFHDALKNNSKNPEFWTDILYLGMKVGDRFAPHAKIS
tara:strand:+ start:48 stop:1472 length:1425 start_codon:yes stop_codon:yes gene_type:complete